MSLHYTTEEYYRKYIDLQEKLRRSEEERLMLEMKFNEMVQHTREEGQIYVRKLHSQYKGFLEEDRKRRERNEQILRNLDRIEHRVAMITAKTESFKLLTNQYHDYLQRTYHAGTPLSSPRDDRVLEKYLNNLTIERYRRMERLFPSPNINVSYKNYSRSYDDGNVMNKSYFSNISRRESANGFKDETAKPKYYPEYSKQKPPIRTPTVGPSRVEPNLTFHKESILHDDAETDSSASSEEPQESHMRQIECQINVHPRNDRRSYDDTKSRKLQIQFKFNKRFGRSNYKRDNIRDKLDETKEKLNKLLIKYKVNQYGNVKNKNPKNYEENVKDMIERHTGRKFLEPEIKCTSQYTNNINTENCLRSSVQTQSYSGNLSNHYEYKPLSELLKEKQIERRVEFLHENISGFPTPRDQLKREEIFPIIDHERKPEMVQSSYKNGHSVPFEKSRESRHQIKNHSPSIETTILEQNSNLKSTNHENDKDDYNEKDEIFTDDKYNDTQHNSEISTEKMKQNHDLVHENILKSIDTIQKEQLIDNIILDEPTDKSKDKYNQLSNNKSNIENSTDDKHSVNNFEESTNSISKIEEQKENTEGEYKDGILSDEKNIKTDTVEKNVEETYEDNKQVSNFDENDTIQQNYSESGQYSLQLDENGQTIPQYNENTQLIQQYDENGQPIQYDPQYTQQYDENGQPIQFDENGQPFAYQYDESGQLIQQYDENGQPLQYQYDETGQYLQQYDENGHPIQYQYDENGQLIQYDENGQPIQYQYDENEQPVQQFYVSGQEYYEGDIQQQYDKNIHQNADVNKTGLQHSDKQQENDQNSELKIMENKSEIMQDVSQAQAKIENTPEVELSQTEKRDIQTNETEEEAQLEPLPDNGKNQTDASEKPVTVIDMLDTDTESMKQDTKVSQDSDFDFSNA